MEVFSERQKAEISDTYKYLVDQFRMGSGLTYRQLAKMLGYELSTVSKWIHSGRSRYIVHTMERVKIAASIAGKTQLELVALLTDEHVSKYSASNLRAWERDVLESLHNADSTARYMFIKTVLKPSCRRGGYKIDQILEISSKIAVLDNKRIDLIETMADSWRAKAAGD